MNAEQTVREFLALFHTEKLDVAALRSLLADGATYHSIVPLGPVHTGADAVIEELERQYELYDDCTCDMVTLAVTGSTVFTERVDRVRQLATGKRTATNVVGIFEVEDGKITGWREYWDALDCAKQLGISGEDMHAVMCIPDSAEA